MNTKKHTRQAALFACFLTGLSTSAWAQQPGQLVIDQAVELRFRTSSGKSYAIEGSNDFNQWTQVGGARYGDGGVQRRFVSVDDPDNNLQFFRLNVVDGETTGFAPSSLVGATLILNTGGFPVSASFGPNELADVVTVNGTTAYRYGYLKTGDNQGALSLWKENDVREDYKLEYTGTEAGAFRLETFLGEQLDDVDVGTFTVQAAANVPPVPGGGENPPQPPVPPTPPLPPVPPVGEPGVAKAVLAGLSFVFNDGGEPLWVQFQDEVNGRAVDDDEFEPFTYEIQPVNESEQILKITLDDELLEAHLIYTGECSGTYVLREFEEGQLDDVDSGTFSVSTEPITANPGDDDDEEGDHDDDDGDHDDNEGEGDHDDNDGDHDDDEGEGDHDDDDGDHDDDEGEGDHDDDDGDHDDDEGEGDHDDDDADHDDDEGDNDNEDGDIDDDEGEDGEESTDPMSMDGESANLAGTEGEEEGDSEDPEGTDSGDHDDDDTEDGDEPGDHDDDDAEDGDEPGDHDDDDAEDGDEPGDHDDDDAEDGDEPGDHDDDDAEDGDEPGDHDDDDAEDGDHDDDDDDRGDKEGRGEDDDDDDDDEDEEEDDDDDDSDD